MERYTRAFLDDVYQRLDGLAPDTEPKWGRMRPPQLFAHLATAVRYGLGKEPLTPDEGGVFGHHVVAPLILNGLMKLPKNVKAPKMYDTQLPQASLDDFRVEADEFLERYNARSIAPPPHPYFGDVGLEGWCKIHVAHFQHHMRQFGV